MKQRIIVSVLMAIVFASLLAPITDRQASEAQAMYSLIECQLAADYGWENYAYNTICVFAMQSEGLDGSGDEWGWY